MLVYCRLYTPRINFAGTHLYTLVGRGTVRFKCLAQEHNTMSPAKAKPLDPELSPLVSMWLPGLPSVSLVNLCFIVRLLSKRSKYWAQAGAHGESD